MTSEGKRKELRLLPPQIAVIYLVLAGAAHWFFDPDRLFQSNLIAAALVTAGFVLMLSAWRLFKRAGTAIKPYDWPSKLVVNGPYQLSRNPMYLGITLILLGVAFWVGTYPFYLAPGVFCLTMNFVFVPNEEKNLESIFGNDFLSYKSRTRRWI